MKHTPEQIITLIVILFFLAVKQVLFTSFVPAWNGHDEPAHFSYTQYLVEEKKLPRMEGKRLESKTLSFSEEYAESELLTDSTRIMAGPNKQFRNLQQRFGPAFYKDKNRLSEQLSNLSRHPLKSLTGQKKYQDLYYRLPSSGLYQNSASLYQPLYYLIMAIPYKLFYQSDILTRMWAMRFFNILIFLGILLLGYLLSWQLTKNFSFSLTLLIIIGTEPVLSHLLAGINNGNLLILVTTATIFFSLKLFNKFTLKNSLTLGAILGLGMLTKPQFIVFPVAAALPFLFYFFRKTGSNINKKKALTYFFACFLIMILISGWWYAWNYSNYGHLFFQSLPPSLKTVSHNLDIKTIIFNYLARWLYAFASFSFAFGFSTETAMPMPIIATTILFAILSIAGLLSWLTKKWRKITLNKKFTGLILVFPIIMLELLLLYLFTKNLFRFGYSRFPIDGRYYLPVIFSIGFFFLFGLISLVPKEFHKHVYITVIITSLAINAIAIFITLTQKYYL